MAKRGLVFVFMLWTLMMGMVGSGCTHSSRLLPVHNEVLVYPLALDLTYLRTLEALQSHPDWELDWTDKEKGVISVRNLRYSSFADADMRTALLVLKRLGPQKTSIQLGAESQAVRGGGELLSLIKQFLSQDTAPT